jgi:hypothetical protein
VLDDFGFSFTLEPLADGSARVRNETYYRPRSLFARFLSMLVMRRKFRGIRLVALANLRRLSTAGHVAGPPVVALVTRG